MWRTAFRGRCVGAGGQPEPGASLSEKASATPHSADLGAWAHGRTMKTTDIGFRETKKVALTVPGDAAPGEHVVKLTVTPTAGQPHTLDLRVQVAIGI
jgi:hypothetical protein